jgi:putative ABC transport system ATP-binding protein
VIARCDGVVKTYRTAGSEVRALKGVTARFDEGTLAAVVGPSGSGKSSLLRLLAGLDRPDAGSIEVARVQIHLASARGLRSLRRGTVGYVFQRPSDNFFAHLSVGEHLARAARRSRHGMAPSEVLDALGLADRVEHRPSELSGGEQQRAAIAQVLVAGAKLVIADEPTAELDSSSAARVLEAIRVLTARGVAFILATHDPAVMEVADASLSLEEGLAVRSRGARPRAVRGPETPVRDDGIAFQPNVLEVRGVRKTYRTGDEEVRAVAGVDLDLRRSEIAGLIGRSGSGKTTLLNVIAGWERPDAGGVAVEGRELGATPSWSEIAVLPQRLGLIEEFTVRENVEYPARLTGSLEERTVVIDRLIEDLGLNLLQDRYPNETSVGEQQRAALARALVLSPIVVLADEPTGHQDLRSADRIFAAVRHASDKGTACLMATHDENVIQFLDRILPMVDGRLADHVA